MKNVKCVRSLPSTAHRGALPNRQIHFKQVPRRLPAQPSAARMLRNCAKRFLDSGCGHGSRRRSMSDSPCVIHTRLWKSATLPTSNSLPDCSSPWSRVSIRRSASTGTVSRDLLKTRSGLWTGPGIRTFGWETPGQSSACEIYCFASGQDGAGAGPANVREQETPRYLNRPRHLPKILSRPQHGSRPGWQAHETIGQSVTLRRRP